jgi:hypothetical protein
MSDYKVGDHLQVKLSGGRIAEATVKAIVDTTDGVRLQVSFWGEQRKYFCGRSSMMFVDLSSKNSSDSIPVAESALPYHHMRPIS